MANGRGSGQAFQRLKPLSRRPARAAELRVAEQGLPQRGLCPVLLALQSPGGQRGTEPNDQQQNEHRRAQTGHDGLAPAPTPSFAKPADRSSKDRFSGQESPQLGRQLLSAWVTSFRLLFQALQANRLQVSRHTWIEEPWREGILLHHLLDGFV